MRRFFHQILALTVGLVVVGMAGYLSVLAWEPSSKLKVAQDNDSRAHFKEMLSGASAGKHLSSVSYSDGGYRTHALAYDISQADFLRLANRDGSPKNFWSITDPEHFRGLIEPALPTQIFREHLGKDFNPRSATFYTQSEGSDGELWIFDRVASRGYFITWSG